jgi:hypothetical protein
VKATKKPAAPSVKSRKADKPRGKPARVRADSKQAKVIALLNRAQGATISTDPLVGFVRVRRSRLRANSIWSRAGQMGLTARAIDQCSRATA